MLTRPLGHSDLIVSQLALGCMYWGSRVDEAQSLALLDQYVDAGGTFLDTANNYAFWVEGYAGGESERVIGRWIKERGRRDRVVLATKAGYNMPPRVPISLARSTITEQCEQSLRNLGTDYIDLYYAHIDDRATPLEETLEALDRLVQDGKVRAIGCSNTLAWRIEQARQISRQHGWAEYCCVQQRHTYLRLKPGIARFPNAHVPVTVDLLDYATAHADTFSVVAYSTLLGGVYSSADHRIAPYNDPDAYDPADARARLGVLHEIVAETGATANQVVLAWITQSTPAMIALIAASSPDRLQENLDSDQLRLTADQIARLDQAGA